MNKLLLLTTILLVASATPLWDASKAWKWYGAYNWSAGVNYIPSYAVNVLEMWQSYDPIAIETELGWAEKLGFSVLRVFLHTKLHIADATTLKTNMRRFLTSAEKHNLKVMFVLFDDCWNYEYKLGKQPDPIPGIHNSQWVQCPGFEKFTDDEVRNYVTDLLRTFARDNRVVMWDLYNQVGNSAHLNSSFPLMKLVFQSARSVDIDQPITSGHWNDDSGYKSINEYILTNSDIITFHAYCDVACTQQAIKRFNALGRPTVCTEYMARPLGSTFITHLPVFKAGNTWAISWGFVFGRTQTYYPWWSTQGAPVPDIWFHDVLDTQGKPFRQAEADFIRNVTSF